MAMSEPYERLQFARERAGFDTPTEAAIYFGFNVVTYRSHENGTRGIRREAAQRYAKAFKVPAGWLLTGEGGTHLRASEEDVLLTIWAELPPVQRKQALRILRALKEEEPPPSPPTKARRRTKVPE
jgi:hypothetical protein